MSYFAGRYYAPRFYAVRYFPGGVVVSFPTQYEGLRFYHGAIQSLCLVLPIDAPSGDTPTINKNGTTYAVYLVDISDPDASTIRINTSSGVKAIRLKT